MATAKKAAKKPAPKPAAKKTAAPLKKTAITSPPPKSSGKKQVPAKPKPQSTPPAAFKLSEAQRVPLDIIIPDRNQPRKFFDEKGLQELAASIAQIDIIEPILLRPTGDGLFMLVVGERRVRSSRIAGKVDIPALIRELTDEQAFEIQIAENLQRHDPHPMEEAYAFKRMLDNGKTVDEIAHRVCKSDRFVAMRLMLNDLIQPFQDVFFANKMTLGQAVMLAKVDPEQQGTIFTENVPSDWNELVGYQLEDLEYLIDRDEHQLSKAPFDTEDTALYAEMGSCKGCRFNSLNTLLLFIDGNDAICSNSACYNIKCVRAYKLNLEKVAQEPDVIFVAGRHYNEADKHKVKEAESLGVPLLHPGKWKRVEAIEDVPEWEEYLKGHNGSEEEAKDDYEELIDDHNKAIIELNEARSKNLVKRAFVVVGNGEGTTIEVIQVTPQGVLELPEVSGLPAGIALQIHELNKREERQKQIDGEKVWKEVLDLMGKGGFETFTNDTLLSIAESSAVVFAMFESLSYISKEYFTKNILKPEERKLTEAQAIESMTEKQYNFLCRLFMKDKLFPVQGSHIANTANYGGFMIAQSIFPKNVQQIVDAQKEKAEKRAKSLKNKIEDLKESVEDEAK